MAGFNSFLLEIANDITEKELADMKFLCEGSEHGLPRGRLESIVQPRDLLRFLSDSGKIGPGDVTFLVNLLNEVHNVKLAERVKKDGGGNSSMPVTENQPVMHESRAPPAASTKPRLSENPEPRFPVQEMPNQEGLVEPLQRFGLDVVETMPSYPMKRRPRGIALIISNEHFENPSTLPDRQGNDQDVQHLQELWQLLNFKVILKPDLKSEAMRKVLKEISTKDHDQYDCFVCCLLSHGEKDGIFGTDGKVVKIQDITALFRGAECPSLASKPKLFFIQACRGKKYDEGAQLQADAPEISSEEAMKWHNAEPNESNFLLGYATPPGYVSWRSPFHGSWYISKLCEVFKRCCEKYDVTSMMVKVNEEVSQAYTSVGYKQCPAPVVTLTKRIYFNKN